MPQRAQIFIRGLTRVIFAKCIFQADGLPDPVYAKASPGFPVLGRRSFSEGGEPGNDGGTYRVGTGLSPR
jgi:hypothetical protein